MIRYTKHSLKKLETLFKEIEYTVRYERGNFQSGYCIVEDRRIAVINRFYDTEGRINCLLEILGQQNIGDYAAQMSESSLKFHQQISQDIPRGTEEE